METILKEFRDMADTLQIAIETQNEILATSLLHSCYLKIKLLQAKIEYELEGK